MVEPWFTPETWHPHSSVHVLTGETSEGKVCRMNVSGQKGRLSFFTFHYLRRKSTEGRPFYKRHELGLFTVEEMKAAFSAAGFTTEYDPAGLDGRGLYVGKENN